MFCTCNHNLPKKTLEIAINSIRLSQKVLLIAFYGTFFIDLNIFLQKDNFETVFTNLCMKHTKYLSSLRNRNLSPFQKNI